MKTTLDIADDVLKAAELLGRRERRSTGEVISDLARRSLGHGVSPAASGHSDAKEAYAQALRNMPTLPRREGPRVTTELVNELRERDD